MMRWRGRAALIAGAMAAHCASALTITSVVSEPAVVAADSAQRVRIRFVIDEPATVVLRIFDAANRQVREIRSDGMLIAGEHALEWDTRDNGGAWVPAEAYVYTLEGTDRSGARVEHDLTDLTGRERLRVRDQEWDSKTGLLSYFLPRNGRVNVRIGLANNGPLLRTAQSWAPRKAGQQSLAWDGKDASGVLDLTHHPKLEIWIDAFSFSDNAILIEPAADRPHERVIAGQQTPMMRTPKTAPVKRMYDHARQPAHTRGDFDVTLTLPEDLKKNSDGLVVVSGLVPVRMSVSDKDRARALARRFEPVFFVDGTFAFENETGFLPMTWIWNTKGTSPGEHFLTVNFRGYEGNFGMATIKVFVEN